MKQRTRKHTKQFSLFAVVGVFNTVLDFVIYNTLIFAFGFVAVIANIFSASLAMLVSFYLNKKYVFKNKQKSARQFALFVLITAVGLYIIQTAIIALLSQETFTFFDLIYNYFSELTGFSFNFFKANAAKAIATGASMIWNYALYHSFVFKDKTNE